MNKQWTKVLNVVITAFSLTGCLFLGLTVVQNTLQPYTDSVNAIEIKGDIVTYNVVMPLFDRYVSQTKQEEYKLIVKEMSEDETMNSLVKEYLDSFTDDVISGEISDHTYKYESIFKDLIARHQDELISLMKTTYSEEEKESNYRIFLSEVDNALSTYYPKQVYESNKNLSGSLYMANRLVYWASTIISFIYPVVLALMIISGLGMLVLLVKLPKKRVSIQKLTGAVAAVSFLGMGAAGIVYYIVYQDYHYSVTGILYLLYIYLGLFVVLIIITWILFLLNHPPKGKTEAAADKTQNTIL